MKALGEHGEARISRLTTLILFKRITKLPSGPRQKQNPEPLELWNSRNYSCADKLPCLSRIPVWSTLQMGPLGSDLSVWSPAVSATQ